MATKFEKIKWELYCKKRKILFAYGIRNGLIRYYDDELIENLRNVYYGGIPGSILLLCDKLCNGHCYDRGLLITLGFGDDDFQLVDADIDGIVLNPEYIDEYRNGKSSEHYGNHCFAERMKSDGSIWVYDTSLGLVIEKSLYYMMQKPKITKINTKQNTLDYIEYQEIKNANIENDKYILPIIMPMIENIANKECGLYHERLREEVNLYKTLIDYDGIVEEVKQDMKRKSYL